MDEMKDHLQELKTNNREEEVRKQELIEQLLNKNLQFKVLSGLEIIVKLEEALKAVTDTSSSERIKQIRSVQVDILTPQDLESLNKTKISQLKLYEHHFAEVFPDLKKITINDQYLQKRYEEICFSIHSKTEKYQELVQHANNKRKLIKQYIKFKNQVEMDKEFLEYQRLKTLRE